MSFYEVGKEIEALRQRIMNLENQVNNKGDWPDWPCNCDDEDGDIDDIDEVTEILNKKEAIVVISQPVTNDVAMKTVIVRNGSEIEKSIVPTDVGAIIYRDNLKMMIVAHPSDTNFDFNQHFTSTYRGLGMGRGSCHGPSRGRCRKLNLDQDCVDRDAFMNRCSGRCATWCGGGMWYWYRDTSCK